MDQKKGGTLLVVDDEAEIREIIELYASTLGFKALEAPDGDAALEILRTQHVDVIVSDLMMPRMTGLGLLDALRSEGFMQPFIFITAYPSQDSTIQALRLGAFDYLEKPFDSEELGTLLTEAMRVSHGMQELGAAVRMPRANPADDDQRAVLEITKLKTLRFDRAPAGGESTKREKLLDLFVNEATPQLLFCEASIKGLQNLDERNFELGYLFRVMQGIGAAAEAVGESQVKTLANAAEGLYTALRVKPRAVSPEYVELAVRVNTALRDLVGRCGDAAAAGDAPNVGEFVVELAIAAREVEAFSAFMAS